MQTHYQRNLPHILPPGESIFITYRLAGSIPADILLKFLEEKQTALRQIAQAGSDEAALRKTQYDEEKRYFARFDKYLDSTDKGPDWLKLPSVAGVVKEGLHHRDGEDYDLHAYCLMSNHVHLLVTIRHEHRPFHATIKSLKGYSARKINELLDRTGQPFWHPESYDHVVRSQEEFKRIVAYILNNPVKAGLVEAWEDWPHSYLADFL
ncbi:transposase [Spirosoma soli]|uniref:Transposase n=1 Tax=Spirosoma soli TaxID=1770529 RepID=A0ABW5LY78_9BACT